MAWEKRANGKRRYYYRTVRSGRTARRVYCGTGVVGQLAADVDARRRAQRDARLDACRAEQARVQSVVILGEQLREECELLCAAALLAAGFHRPHRVPWRKWHAARQA
jgi:hypothetical protein